MVTEGKKILLNKLHIKQLVLNFFIYNIAILYGST